MDNQLNKESSFEKSTELMESESTITSLEPTLTESTPPTKLVTSLETTVPQVKSKTLTEFLKLTEESMNISNKEENEKNIKNISSILEIVEDNKVFFIIILIF